ncbi:hypothetical protein [Parasphingorhabdus sp.]|jgi:hypothetical protein|uniref:hypothetical protein n=1 Tax=Parasphingorhabdus sp. TaxID=2709688 RepID=UPI003BAF6A43
MRVKAEICRAQEARQLDLAVNDPLESRRIIAAAAAKAWGLEAIQAEKREAGHLDPLDKLDAEITTEFAEENLIKRNKYAG